MTAQFLHTAFERSAMSEGRAANLSIIAKRDRRLRVQRASSGESVLCNRAICDKRGDPHSKNWAGLTLSLYLWAHAYFCFSKEHD